MPEFYRLDMPKEEINKTLLTAVLEAQPVVAGNFASFTKDGQIVDSQKTAADFAPSGYGPGDISASVAPKAYDADSILLTGWYVAAINPANFTSGNSLIAHFAYSPEYAIQTAYLFGASTSFGYNVILRRAKERGIWGEWEWDNPIMELGVEYRTTQRYNSKPVYTQLLNFGAMPVNTYKIVAHGISDIDRMISASGNAGGATIPTQTWKNGYWNNNVDITADHANVQIVTRNCTTLTSDVTAEIVLRYTKR